MRLVGALLCLLCLAACGSLSQFVMAPTATPISRPQPIVIPDRPQGGNVTEANTLARREQCLEAGYIADAEFVPCVTAATSPKERVVAEAEDVSVVQVLPAAPPVPMPRLLRKPTEHHDQPR